MLTWVAHVGTVHGEMKEEVPSNKAAHEMASEVVRCLLANGARVVTIQPDVMGGVAW